MELRSARALPLQYYPFATGRLRHSGQCVGRPARFHVEHPTTLTVSRGWGPVPPPPSHTTPPSPTDPLTYATGPGVCTQTIWHGEGTIAGTAKPETAGMDCPTLGDKLELPGGCGSRLEPATSHSQWARGNGFATSACDGAPPPLHTHEVPGPCVRGLARPSWSLSPLGRCRRRLQ